MKGPFILVLIIVILLVGVVSYLTYYSNRNTIPTTSINNTANITTQNTTTTFTTTTSHQTTTASTTTAASTSVSTYASTSSTTASTTTILQESQCSTPSDPEYVLEYSTQHWQVYAHSADWNKYKGYYLSQMSYLDQVYGQLVSMFDVDPASSYTSGKVYFLIYNKTGGGFATGCIGEIGLGPGIGISYDAWSNPYSGTDNWNVELIAHESTNMFTGYVVGGWPVDWWADHKSPFPYATKIIIEQATDHTNAAQASTNSADPLTKMFLSISSTYGQGTYTTMFSDLRADGWTQWFGPNPSQNLGNYVAAYLSIAAGTSLVNTINVAFAQEGGINYTIDATAVDAIISRRAALQEYPRNSPCWQLFRQGNYIFPLSGC